MVNFYANIVVPNVAPTSRMETSKPKCCTYVVPTPKKHKILKNQKPSKAFTDEGFLLVAGDGFEPTTFGL